MDEATRKIIWATSGVGLFSAGFAVTFSTSTAKSTHWWAVAPAIIGLLGVYLFAAALTTSKWFMYPGKSGVVRQAMIASGMKMVLGLYLIMAGRLNQGNHNDNANMIRAWAWSVSDLVGKGWGTHEVVLLSLENQGTPRDQIRVGIDNLRSLMQRTKCVPEDHFSWDETADWCTYITERFPLTMPDINHWIVTDQRDREVRD
jgi:hypothetical protein